MYYSINNKNALQWPYRKKIGKNSGCSLEPQERIKNMYVLKKDIIKIKLQVDKNWNASGKVIFNLVISTFCVCEIDLVLQL